MKGEGEEERGRSGRRGGGEREGWKERREGRGGEEKRGGEGKGKDILFNDTLNSNHPLHLLSPQHTFAARNVQSQ